MARALPTSPFLASKAKRWRIPKLIPHLSTIRVFDLFEPTPPFYGKCFCKNWNTGHCDQNHRSDSWPNPRHLPGEGLLRRVLPAQAGQARHGPGDTATAHKIVRILYHVLSTKEPYTETIFHLYDEQAHQRAEIRFRKRTFLRLFKKLGKIRDTTLQVPKIEFRNPPVLGHVHRVFWWLLVLVNAPLSTLTFSERLDSEEERAT
jgi:hypothetical protein